jgi:Peptidase S46
MNRIGVVIGFLLVLPLSVRADEGMWTYNNFPKDKLKQKYGVDVDQDWLDHLRLSSARLAQGCSASFVSADGLVMTNHHCAHTCIEQLSSPQKDYVKDGFYAKTLADEPKCPAVEVNQLVAITNVTERVRQATAGLADQKYNEAEKAEMSRIETECATGPEVRCDVVSLYRGGLYDLYKYRRFQDVRLVFAPELDIAFFGGDPDNFNFPRYDLDVSFLRVWQDGKPASLDHHLRWSSAGPKAGEVTFVSGHPGGTSRQLTVSQLEYVRDVQLPDRLLRLAELRGLLTEYQRRGPEQKRHSTDLLFSIENSYKALLGEEGALVDKAFFAKLVDREGQLREAVAKNPEWQQTYGGLWDAIARAQDVSRGLRNRYNYLEGGQGFRCELFLHARTLLRAADERGKPLQTRFREYRDSALPALTQQLFSSAPIHDELEITELTFALTKLREILGADDPVVRKVLGVQSPEELATRVIKETKLKDVAVRKALWDGGANAVQASNDPMIVLARLIDTDARAVRKQFEDEVEAPVKRNGELLARLRFAIYGPSAAPDATFTLRLNYGTVRGWTEPGRTIEPFTVLRGAYERATGRDPFALPESWLAAKGKLNLDTPFNVSSDNDIIGGNSGSPVVNAKAEVVGLIFDGNIHSLGGDYGFDDDKNRAVWVDSAALVEALAKIYGADRIVKELTVPAASSSKKKGHH